MQFPGQQSEEAVILALFRAVPLFWKTCPAGLWPVVCNGQVVNSQDLLSQLPEAEDVLERILAINGAESGAYSLRRERRRFPRLEVKWTVHLPGDTGEAANVTRDMSCRGMFFTSGRWFLPGETINCTVLIPMHDPTDRESMLALRTKANVVRIESLAIGAPFGIACRMDECSVELVPNPHALKEMP
jgi:hypothetical protein